MTGSGSTQCALESKLLVLSAAVDWMWKEEREMMALGGIERWKPESPKRTRLRSFAI